MRDAHIAADFGIHTKELPAMRFLRRMSDTVSDPPTVEDTLIEVRKARFFDNMAVFYNKERTEDIIGTYNPVLSEHAPWQGLKKRSQMHANEEAEDPNLHSEI